MVSNRATRPLILLFFAAALPLGAQSVSALQASAPAAQSVPLASFDSTWASLSRSYYDTALIAGRWTAVRDSLRTELGDAPDNEQARAAIRALIRVPGQSHFTLIPREASLPSTETGRDGAPGTTGLDLRLIGDTLIVWRVAAGSPAALASVRAGWTVTHLDTLPVAALQAQLAQAFPAEEQFRRTLLVTVSNGRVQQSVLDTVTVTFTDFAGIQQTITMPHVAPPGIVTRFGNLPPQVIQVTLDTVRTGRGRREVAIPVLHWSAWFPVASPILDDHLFALRNAPGIVLDLRGNPGGVVGMISGIAGHFADSMLNLGTMYGRGSTLFLRANPRTVDRRGERVPVIRAPVAILVDGNTASSSEFFAAGMQALGRARVFGEPTSGQALPALMLRLPNGDVLMHPIADHEDANGRRVEGVGVQPDVRVPLSRPLLRDGRDPALDAAVTWLARTMSR